MEDIANGKNTELTEPKTKFIKDTFSVYLGNREAISASDIKTFLKCPRLYKYKLDNYGKESEEEKKHLMLGTAIHHAILEPESFYDLFASVPKVDKRTTQGKADWARFEFENAGKTLLDASDMEIIEGIKKSASGKEDLQKLLLNSEPEVSIYTSDDTTGLKIKLRPDALSLDKPTITDLKSTLDSSIYSFSRDVFKWGYDVSAAFYTDFSGKQNYIFAALDKTPPHCIGLFQLHQTIIEDGRDKYRMALDLIKWSRDNDYWCDYSEFDLLKALYKENCLHQFFDALKKTSRIQTIYRNA